MQFARIVAALALVALGACSEGLSKDEFIEQADRICEEADAKSEELAPPRTPEEFEAFAGRAREITDQLVRDLGELEPPEGDAQVIEQMLDRIQTTIALLPDIQEATAARNTQEVERLVTQLREQASEANRIAQEYGLKVCGRSEPAAVP